MSEPGNNTKQPRRRPLRAALGGLAAVLAVLIAAAGLVVLTPLFDRTLVSQPAAAADYEAAMARSSALAQRDGTDIDPVCRSRVIDQGRQSEQAVVLLHGFTNCPAQFEVIAQAYAEAGYSVVVPRLPGHGAVDKLTRSPSAVTSDQLIATADEAIDIAAGLGQRVTVVGLSGGATVAGWSAANRSEVAEAVVIAPLVVPKAVPELLVAPLARAARFLPDMYLWWDSGLKEELVTPPYAYPRYSLRSLGAYLALGRATQVEDPSRSTDLERLVVVSNDHDNAVSNAGVNELAASLGEVLGDESTGIRVDKEFPDSAGFKHDLVDPQGENADLLPAIYAELGPLLGLPELADQLDR